MTTTGYEWLISMVEEFLDSSPDTRR